MFLCYIILHKNKCVLLKLLVPSPAVSDCDLDTSDHEDWERKITIGLRNLLNSSQVFKHHVAKNMTFFELNNCVKTRTK